MAARSKRKVSRKKKTAAKRPQTLIPMSKDDLETVRVAELRHTDILAKHFGLTAEVARVEQNLDKARETLKVLMTQGQKAKLDLDALVSTVGAKYLPKTKSEEWAFDTQKGAYVKKV